MQLVDTPSEVRRRQIAVYRGMTPQQRVDVAIGLSEEVRAIAIAGIRSRNPALNDDEVLREWLALLHGSGLARLHGAVSPRP